MKGRITVLLGAGAVFEIEGPTTEYITDEVKKLNIRINNSYDDNFTSFFIQNVANRLEEFYSERVSFEEIFNGIEYLNSYSEAWKDIKGRPKKLYKPSLAAFLEPSQKYLSFFENHNIKTISRQFIERVSDIVNEYNSKEPAKWFKDFFFNLHEQNNLDCRLPLYLDHLKLEVLFLSSSDKFFRCFEV